VLSRDHLVSKDLVELLKLLGALAVAGMEGRDESGQDEDFEDEIAGNKFDDLFIKIVMNSG
jgi:hypothetical protein